MAPLSDYLVDLVQKNAENLAKDLKSHLEETNKLTQFEVDDIYPLLYNSLTNELSEHFKKLDINQKYTGEIEKEKYDHAERQLYYDYLFVETASKLMKFKPNIE